jgi:quinoprotein glucose dehydrogenase
MSIAARTSFLAASLLVAGGVARAQSATDWPVYGGSDDHSHYSTLDQISPANVKRLKVAWTYDTRDAFAGSEMQTNPVVIDGVLYGTSPKLRVFALDGATGKELWSFDPNYGAAPTSRIRHRGVVVTGDRVLFNFRNRLYALDRRTGKPSAPSVTRGGWTSAPDSVARWKAFR